MSNSIPTNVGQRITLAVTMSKGVQDDGAALDITQISAATLTEQATALLTLDGNYNAGRTAVQAASTAVVSSDADLLAWVGSVKIALMISFGQRWSADWVQVGFLTPSLELPKVLSAQLTLAQAMIIFLTNNPSYEVPAKSVTAAAGQALVTARTTRRTTLSNLEKAQLTLDGDWTAAYDALGDSMWLLVRILETKLGKDDPRWKDFGLKLPGVPSTPGQPQNLQAHLDEQGSIIMVSCDPLPLATRYRFRLRLVGVETDFRLAASSTAPLAIIGDVLPGHTVELIAQAVNRGLQSVASEPVFLTIPLPVVASAMSAISQPVAEAKPLPVAETVESVTESLPPVHRNGHSTNGNGLHAAAR